MTLILAIIYNMKLIFFEGIEHLAEEERTSRSQTTTDDEDEELPKLLSPDETLSLVGARFLFYKRLLFNKRPTKLSIFKI